MKTIRSLLPERTVDKAPEPPLLFLNEMAINMTSVGSFLMIVAFALCLSFVRAQASSFMVSADANTTTTCANLTNCYTCASNVSCGWCPALGQCLEGSADRSANGACNVTHGGWHFNETECRNCSSFTNCKSCVEAYSSNNGTKTVCGWCAGSGKENGTCWEGTVDGPLFKGVNNTSVCAQKSWGLSSSSCDDKDSEKRKLAIIIGLSVAGGLFVLAVVATIIFVIIKRAQRARGYQAINESA